MDYDYVAEPDSNLCCPICRNAFLKPTMASNCQHIFCEDCITRAIDLSPTCPIDRSELNLNLLISAPRIIIQMVNELKVSCSSKEAGCSWIGERERLEDHLRLDCGTNLKGKGVELEQKGATEISTCFLCQALLESQVDHKEVCPYLPVTCTYCFDAILHRSTLPAHLLSCPAIEISCPHSLHGCTARLRRDQMVDEHLDLTCSYEPMKEFLQRYEMRMNSVEGENLELRNRVGGLEASMRDMRNILDGITGGLGAFYNPPTEPEIDLTFANLSSNQEPTLPQPALLSSTIESVTMSIQTLNSEILAIENRQNEDFSIQDETLSKFSEEMNSMRGILHGMRMQMHHLLMEFNRLNSPSIFAQRTGMISGSSHVEDNGSSDSISDEESSNPMLPRFMNRFSNPFPTPLYSGNSSSGSNSSGVGGVRRYSQQETKL